MPLVDFFLPLWYHKMMEMDALAAAPPTSLHDALEMLSASGLPTLPIVDPETGLVLAVLARPDAMPAPAPPRLGGMATPLGVYLHDGVSSGGAGFWGLFLTGVTMSLLALTAQAVAQGLSLAAVSHPALWARWQALAPPGVQTWLAAVSPWLPLPLVFLLLRLLPMSGTHAAEHQVVHCIERHTPLTPSCVRAMPRVHPRCGTNLFAGFTLFLMTFLGVFCAATAWGWAMLDSVSLAAMLAAPLTLAYWRRVGGWIQFWFATRPASDRQIAGAIRAADEVLVRRKQRMESRQQDRFLVPRRVWTMGIAQIFLGYLAVFSALTLMGRVWPGSARWIAI